MLTPFSFPAYFAEEIHYISIFLLNEVEADIFDKRQTGDYDDFVDFSKEEVISMVEPAKQLIAKIDSLLSL